MNNSFDEMLNISGYVFVGIGKTIGVFSAIGIFVLLIGYIFSLFGIDIIGDVASPWVLSFHFLIVSIYGLILNSIFYCYRLKLLKHKMFGLIFHGLSFPISVSIMMRYCSEHLCYL